MKKGDFNPTAIRWTDLTVKHFLQKEASEKDRSLNYLINKILKDYKEGKLKYSGTASN